MIRFWNMLVFAVAHVRIVKLEDNENCKYFYRSASIDNNEMI